MGGASREGIQRSQEQLLCADETLRVSLTPHGFHTLFDSRPTGQRSRNAFVHIVYSMHTVKRTTITLREDQHEWIQEHHLNLSSFIREQLDEYIEEHE